MIDRWIVDNRPSARYPIYTRANAGEVYPDPVSPMSATVQFLAGGEAGWRDSYLRYTMRRDEFELTEPEILGCFGGYVYLNMSLTRLFGVRMPGMTAEQVDLQYFGEMPGIPPYRHEPWHDDPERTAALGAWVQELLTATDLPELRDDRASVDAQVAARPDLTALRDDELVARIRSFVPTYRRLFDRHITVSAASGFGVGVVHGILDALDETDLTMTLFAGMGDVDSAAPSFAMWELSRLVSSSPTLTAAFDEGLDGLLERIEQLPAEPTVDRFRADVSTFLREYGSRGPNEWELRSPTWGTRPRLFLAAVDRMRGAPDEESPAVRHERRITQAREEADRVRRMLPDEARANFDAGLSSGRLHLQGRERTKTTIIKIVHEQRLAARELGRRAVDGGTIDSVAQVFMLKDDELDEFVLYPEAWTQVVRERERRYLELFDLEPPFIIDGVVPPLSEWPRRGQQHETLQAGDVIEGIAGCPGTAQGRARVVLDPSDPSALEPGDVLVAPITDPAWTPLFVPACAVVVDVGAQVSHAVIVSRELGIPCVVSARDATKRIPDGATVKVDGARGTVEVLER